MRSPLVRLPPELRNLIYDRLDVIERENFGRDPRDYGKIINFPRILALTCRLFYYELADLPFSLNSNQCHGSDKILCMLFRHVKTLRIRAWKHPSEKAPHEFSYSLTQLPLWRQLRRIHICVLLDASPTDNWLNDPYRPQWEYNVRRKLCLERPCVKEVVFEYEMATY
jgi:hypothetical protein